jgi:hypothetical protein
MGDNLCCDPFQTCFGGEVSKSSANMFADIVLFLQEFVAVLFHLVCLSRLEGASADIKSNLCLLLTLVVFTGPYLNAWLAFAENIIFKKWDKPQMTLGNIGMGLGITTAHVLGAITAWGLVNWMRPAAHNTITWEQKNAITKDLIGDKDKEKAMWKNENWHVYLLEEIFAVSSLIIGFIYLWWLMKLRKAKIPQHNERWIKIDIKFYFQLTLLVAAVAQAFPSAHLSPHILSYKLLMQTITIPEFLSRLGGGAIGLGIGSLWCLFRVSYRESVQTKLDPDHDHKDSYKDSSAAAYHQVPALSTGQKAYINPPSIRLSMHGSSYF